MLCLICACVQSGNKKNVNGPKNKTCDTSVLFGDVNICIPNVKGYKDAHSFPDMAKQSVIEARKAIAQENIAKDIHALKTQMDRIEALLKKSASKTGKTETKSGPI